MSDTILPLTRGLTVREVARRLRVGEDRVRTWIKSGRLPAINTSDGRRPRFVVLPEQLADFVQARSAAPLKPMPKRQKMTNAIDFYPDAP